MIIQYITLRFGILKFAAFAILLCLLGLTKIPDWQIFVENFIFIFTSLFAFRLLDDVWSFYLDRIHHPERTYLIPENFRNFIALTVFVFTIYLIGLFLFSRDFAITILVLILVSTVFYALFFKIKSILTIIPLLKYPVLIWCISRFSLSTEVLLLFAGAFFMMLTSDYIDENKSTNTKYKILLILITGLLIFQPWVENKKMIQGIILVLLPIIPFTFLKIKRIALFPIIAFPLFHLIDLII